MHLSRKERYSMISKTIAGAILLLLLLWLIYTFIQAIKEFMKPTVEDQHISIRTVYPFEYNANKPVYENIKMKAHWKSERLMASARIRTFESFEMLDEQIYMITYWPECEEQEVRSHIKLAYDLIQDWDPQFQ